MLDLTTKQRTLFLMLAIGFALPAGYNLFQAATLKDATLKTVTGTLTPQNEPKGPRLMVSDGTTSGWCPRTKCAGQSVESAIGSRVTAQVDGTDRIVVIQRLDQEIFRDATERERRILSTYAYGGLTVFFSILSFVYKN
jgi:hypothetical protein